MNKICFFQAARSFPVSCFLLRAVVILLFCMGCASGSGGGGASPEAGYGGEQVSRLLARTINFGNALDAPSEGAWGVVLQAGYFRLAREAGFTAVRLPVRWSAHALQAPPYTIDPSFVERVRWAVEQAFANDLAIVVNVHHYDELNDDPEAHASRFLALWEQIAEAFEGLSPSLIFELLNEPAGELTTERWNPLMHEALRRVRVRHPARMVVVGGGNWNALDELEAVDWPADDPHVMATFHYYQPFAFTHQGASWVPDTDRWLGRGFPEHAREKAKIRRDFERAADWARRHGIPVFLGEFGAYGTAAMPDRARWTRFVREQAEHHGIPWAYWEFCAGFGVYDPEAGKWRESLLDALIP